MLASKFLFRFVLFVSLTICQITISNGVPAQDQQPNTSTAPIVNQEVVFQEVDGLLVLEAEHFFEQSKTEKRSWHIISTLDQSTPKPDADPSHLAGASGGYLEILPDTRSTHKETLISGENFIDVAGEMAILSYQVNFNQPGRYYVWGRTYSTGPEDNGFHIGMNNTWPESGQRWQTVNKNKWNWDCKQRTEQEHTGVPMQLYLDIDKPGKHIIQLSMREDGFELDKLILAKDKSYKPEGKGPQFQVVSGTKAPKVIDNKLEEPKSVAEVTTFTTSANELSLFAPSFSLDNTGYYLDKKKWLAINPEEHKSAATTLASPFPSGKYHLTLYTVGEEDGESTYQVFINDKQVGDFKTPLGDAVYVEGDKYNHTVENIEVSRGDIVKIASQIASKDGKEFSRARIAKLHFKPADKETEMSATKYLETAAANVPPAKAAQPNNALPLVLPRQANGDLSTKVSGELKQWHKVIVDFHGPYAHELDNEPNPFTDIGVSVLFSHAESKAVFHVPGYFAADGNSANTGAVSGTIWRTHFTPDHTGEWKYQVFVATGKEAALKLLSTSPTEKPVAMGAFTISPSDKPATDFRTKGRLNYVGKHYLQFAGSKEYFIKAGPDSPETLMAYADFDNTQALKSNVKLHKYPPHLDDWKSGDPTWGDGKGKSIIGAMNYLNKQGVNSISFLPYNAGGDGDNIWPFVTRDDKFHYDCSKLAQWGIVLDHASAQGLFLHFKLQENEIDDNRHGMEKKSSVVPESLDGGKLGTERKLYCREIIARFGHALALNWNLGEENTQSTEEIIDMAKYLHELDPYKNLIVIHTFPPQQEEVYTPLLGKKSFITGASLQNSWQSAHQKTLKWVKESTQAGQPWVVCNDEQGPASHGVPCDPGYAGNDGTAKEGKSVYTAHDVRKLCLWGTLMAGGAGVEYYYGYQLPDNDLNLENFRCRETSYKYASIAINFFREHKIPVAEMSNHDELVGNKENKNTRFCLAQPDSIYLVYLPTAEPTELDLTGTSKSFSVKWFNPRTGGELVDGSVKSIQGGKKVDLGNPPQDAEADWLVIIK